MSDQLNIFPDAAPTEDPNEVETILIYSEIESDYHKYMLSLSSNYLCAHRLRVVNF